MQTDKTEFRYHWSTNRIAILCSFTFFLALSVVCWYANSVRPNPIALILACLFLIPAVLRGYGLFVALTRSPRSLYVENAILVGEMIGGHVRRIPMKDIREIRKGSMESLCSQFSILIVPTLYDDALIVRNEAENNAKLIELACHANPSCRIEHSVRSRIAEESSQKQHGFQISHRVPLFTSMVLLVASAYSFLAQPKEGLSKAEQLGAAQHQFYGYLTLLCALLLAVMAFALHRRSKSRGLPEPSGKRS